MTREDRHARRDMLQAREHQNRQLHHVDTDKIATAMANDWIGRYVRSQWNKQEFKVVSWSRTSRPWTIRLNSDPDVVGRRHYAYRHLRAHTRFEDHQ